ncbi:hypothetical protein RHA1_ro03155 [Rhodococcus jostii RHA1]|uniref:Uncharacterized protein n=1 Tax=Rhodococcus jostii (strain RHA1) TaxID=101510 RepID=Q0SBX8_RHOJR|nr:hypothetical protein RHA1_ro03155 [Rhodococcus jostii RHA1]
MQGDDEGEERGPGVGVALGDQGLPRAAEPRGQQDRVAQARDREQLGHALEGAEDDRLGVGQCRHPDSMAAAVAVGNPDVTRPRIRCGSVPTLRGKDFRVYPRRWRVDGTRWSLRIH